MKMIFLDKMTFKKIIDIMMLGVIISVLDVFYKFFMEKICKKSFTECETEFAQMDNYKWSLEGK